MFSTAFRSATGQQPTGNAPQESDSTPWMITTGAKAVGSVAGVVSIFMGFLNLLSILDIKCIFVGALLMIEGFIMILAEAPCCCMFLDFAYMPATILDKRPPLIKAVLYLLFAMIPFLWCFGLSTFLSGGLMMGTSAFYVLMAMGKKANREEMRVKSAATAAPNGSNASAPPQPSISSNPTAVLVQNEELPEPTIKSGVIY